MLSYKDYCAIIQFDADDETFYGQIHGINDLVTFEGQSVKQLKTAFKEAVLEYLETCKKLNKEPNKTYKGNLNIRINPLLHSTAAALAERKNISLNAFIGKALEFAIRNEHRIDPAK
jgi:predicted HicB family RNase H-like nuclease